MSMMNRSQDGYLRTGTPNSFRVAGVEGDYYVEGTDRNGTWVDAEPGFRYATEGEAEDAMDSLIAQASE